MAMLKYWIWLSARKNLKLNTGEDLVDFFGSPEKVYLAGEDELRKTGLVKKEELPSLLDKDLDQAQKTISFCHKYKVKILTINDSAYPDRLRNIYGAPLVLYVLGRLPDMDDEAAVAIVGTRKCTDYGEKNAERIAKEYAGCGGVVVTGLATGIDSAAARGAIKGGGQVVAVLGSGINVLYPASNKKLFREVFRHGAIITEFPPGTRPERWNFPRRNRIISGLSVGVLVVEAPVKSGSLITAARAAEQGRDVFVLPGDVDKETFAGSMGLLKDGAGVITSGYELVDEYIALYPDKLQIRESEESESTRENTGERHNKDVKKEQIDNKSTKKAVDNKNSIEYIDIKDKIDSISDDEKAVMAFMQTGVAVHIDEIIANTGLPASKVASALTLLQLKGYVSQHTGKNFTLEVVFDF